MELQNSHWRIPKQALFSAIYQVFHSTSFYFFTYKIDIFDAQPLRKFDISNFYFCLTQNFGQNEIFSPGGDKIESIFFTLFGPKIVFLSQLFDTQSTATRQRRVLLFKDGVTRKFFCSKMLSSELSKDDSCLGVGKPGKKKQIIKSFHF